MLKKCVFSCLTFLCLLSLKAYPEHIAPKRLAPDEVVSVVYEGLRYEAPTSKMGYVEAYDVATGKLLWEKKVYDVKYGPALEKDVQDVFIKELKIEEGKGDVDLIAIDEQGKEHSLRIKEFSIIAPEMTINFWVDKKGGMYSCVNANPLAGGCRYDNYIQPLLKSPDLNKLILIAERKYVSTPAFDQEFLTLLKEARKNQKVVEIRRPCPECKCDDGYWHNIYDYQDKEAQIRTDRPVYARGEKVSFTVTNASNFSRYFSVVSAEKLINGEWREAIRDAVCGCRKYCDTLGYVVDPGKAVTMSWDQSIMDNGCINAPAYPYRFVISDLYGGKDKGECETYHSVIYSNVFQIRE